MGHPSCVRGNSYISAFWPSFSQTHIYSTSPLRFPLTHIFPRRASAPPAFLRPQSSKEAFQFPGLPVRGLEVTTLLLCPMTKQLNSLKNPQLFSDPWRARAKPLPPGLERQGCRGSHGFPKLGLTRGCRHRNWCGEEKLNCHWSCCRLTGDQ